MSLLQDMIDSYRAPHRAIARQVLRDSSESRTLESHTLMLAFLSGVLVFLARLPALLIYAEQSGQVFFYLFAQALVSFVFVAPLVWYLVATGLYGILYLLGARCGGAVARYVFFWSLILSLPFVLAFGLAAPFGVIWLDWTLPLLASIVFVGHYILGVNIVFFTENKRANERANKRAKNNKKGHANG